MFISSDIDDLKTLCSIPVFLSFPSLTCLNQFEERGFTVLENFLTDTEVEALRSECHALVEDMDPKEHHSIFKSHATVSSQYIQAWAKCLTFADIFKHSLLNKSMG